MKLSVQSFEIDTYRCDGHSLCIHTTATLRNMFLQQCHSFYNNGNDVRRSRCSGFCRKLILLYQSTFAPYIHIYAYTHSILIRYSLHWHSYFIISIIYIYICICVCVISHAQWTLFFASHPLTLLLEKGRSSLSDGYYNNTSPSAAREYI